MTIQSAIQKYLILGRQRSPFLFFFVLLIVLCLPVLPLLTRFRYVQTREEGGGVGCTSILTIDKPSMLSCSKRHTYLSKIPHHFPQNPAGKSFIPIDSWTRSASSNARPRHSEQSEESLSWARRNIGYATGVVTADTSIYPCTIEL